MSLNGERSSNPNGFRVEVSGSEPTLRWLKSTDKIASLPVEIHGHDEDAMLDLGGLEIHNTLIHRIDSRALYIPGGSYELSTVVLPKQENRDPEEVLRELRQESESNSFMSILGVAPMSRKSFGELPVSIPALAEVMQSSSNLPGYKVEFDKNEQDIQIFPDEESDNSDQSKSFLSEMSTPFGPAYHLKSLKEKLPSDPEEFAKKFDFHGRLIEGIVLSLYAIKQEKTPGSVYNFTPPDNIEVIIKKQEQKLLFAKKQLTAAGYLEDGDDEDIDQKIVLERPAIRFRDIGGQEKAKTELSDVVAGLEDPDEFYMEGAEPPNGVLLYGPSGTGKTLLARATAGEAKAKIFSVGLASILHSLFGKTERYIQRVFDKAREEAPSIIFFDEIDAIARQRSSMNQVYSSIVNTLLTNMDGMQERPENVVVIGATNLLDLVDDALLRPGRFDLLIPVDLPDPDARAQIFEIRKRKALIRATKPENEIFDPNFNLAKFVKDTDGYSGADIAEILRRGLIERVRMKRRGLTPPPLTSDDLAKQVALYEQIRKDKKSRSSRMGFQQTIKQ